MLRKTKTACLMAGALLAAVPGVTNAETTELEQMRAEMAQMRAEMAQLKADQSGDWMTDTRRAEVEGLIADVFADANNRATLLQEGALAGIDEKGKIFLLSADGSFSANFNGQIQARYIFNTEDNRADESISGFQMRRMKFGVKGKVADGWGYSFRIKGDRDQETATSDVEIDTAYITYKISDTLSMAAGAKKLPFARQELIIPSRQVGVDRAIVTEFFTLNRSDLVEVKYNASDDLVITGAISDGANGHLTDYNADASNDFSVTARADWQAIGDNWKAAKHEFGGTDEDALFVGAAYHHQKADGTGPAQGVDQLDVWTIDALYKTGSLGVTAALFGATLDTVGAADRDPLGWYVQGSYDLGNDWDVFARIEMLDDDAVATEDLEAITFGVNRHFNSNVKFTGDIVWIYAGDTPTAAGGLNSGSLSDGLGLGSTTDAEDQIALRLQLQLLF